MRVDSTAKEPGPPGQANSAGFFYFYFDFHALSAVSMLLKVISSCFYACSDPR